MFLYTHLSLSTVQECMVAFRTRSSNMFLVFRLSKVLLVRVLKQCLANSGMFKPLLVEQQVSN